MQKASIIVFLGSLLFSITSDAAGPVFNPQMVPSISNAERVPTGTVLLKVSVSNDDTASDAQVSVGNITVCTESACFQSTTPTQYIQLYNTKIGRSERVVQMAIPPGTIKSVHFQNISGQKIISGDVSLEEPLQLPVNVAGGEILVLVKRTVAGSNTIYQTTYATGLLYSPSRESIYYNPRFSLAATVSRGGIFALSAGASSAPQIFSIAVHDTGDLFPLIDIFPVRQLSAPGSVSFSPTERGGTKDIGIGMGNAPKLYTKPISSTGVIRYDLKPIPISQTGNEIVAAAVTDTCVSSISSASSTITSALATTGAVYLKDCELVPPYVHIVAINNADPRVLLRLSYNFTGSADSTVFLNRIETWAPQSQVTINGFMWVGDSGMAPGYGRAKGFVQDGPSIVLGNNMIDGGYATGAGYDGNKYMFRVQPLIQPSWREGSIPPLWTDGVSAPYSIVSSSTSIVKNSVCQNNSETIKVDQWSAFGTTANNRLIFISSTSDGKTSAYDLCAVFQALGVTDAIRLDGSTAAGITVDGIRKNQITGSLSFVYGSSRYIAYALRVGYISGITPPATPIISGGRVGPPVNPCKVNPRSCY